MRGPLISVVVPVYNEEKYLEQCLNSILHQTYENIEVVCVNDGSVDASLSILKSFQQADSRIIIINQENGGLSAARNSGLKCVSSNYVTFIDSDDYIDPKYIENLYNQLQRENADFVSCEFAPFGKCDDNNEVAEWFKNRFSQEAPINPNRCPVSSCAKLFKMDIVREHNLQFPKGLTCEDNYWTFLYCFWARKCIVIHERLYFYRRNNANSIMRKTILKNKHLYDVIKVCCLIFDSLPHTDLFSVYKNYLDDLFFVYLRWLINFHNKTVIDKTFWNEIKNYLIRSETAKIRFWNSRYFEMLTDATFE